MNTETIEKYIGVDWKKQDIVIAKKMKLTRERIRQVRRELGHPTALLQHAQTGKRGSVSAAVRGIMGWSGKMTARQICVSVLNRKPTKNNLGAIYQVCAGAGFKVKPAPPPALWHERCPVNWDLSNKDLTDIWGLSGNLVANTRCQFNKPSSKWDARFGRNEREDRLHDKAVEDEIEKARAI